MEKGSRECDTIAWSFISSLQKIELRDKLLAEETKKIKIYQYIRDSFTHQDFLCFQQFSMQNAKWWQRIDWNGINLKKSKEIENWTWKQKWNIKNWFIEILPLILCRKENFSISIDWWRRVKTNMPSQWWAWCLPELAGLILLGRPHHFQLNAYQMSFYFSVRATWFLFSPYKFALFLPALEIKIDCRVRAKRVVLATFWDQTTREWPLVLSFSFCRKRFCSFCFIDFFLMFGFILG